jgi:hypothetical protein
MPARGNADIDVARLRYQLWSRVVDGARVAIWIAVAWLPLTAVAEIARNVAGKNTQFTATVSVTIAISVFLSAGWAVTAYRSHERKKEVERLRGRIDDLELRSLQQKSPSGAEAVADSTSNIGDAS